MTKARACTGASQEWSPRITLHAFESLGKCEGMNPHTPKWAPILGVGAPMDSWIFRGQLQGWKFIDWKVPYIIGKLLERKCLRWARMTYLGTSNISYGQNKGRESNWQFDSRPLKVRNRPDLLLCRWCATYFWKDLDKGYNIALDVTSIGVLHTKLWASKVAVVLI
jgi:hypothetical protein